MVEKHINSVVPIASRVASTAKTRRSVHQKQRDTFTKRRVPPISYLTDVERVCNFIHSTNVSAHEQIKIALNPSIYRGRPAVHRAVGLSLGGQTVSPDSTDAEQRQATC